MKKIINGRSYDTDTATNVGEYWNGRTNRDFQYVFETLYRKKNGEFFLHGEGGAMSRYAEPVGDMRGAGEKIIPMTEEEAREWAEEHLDADEYVSVFGDPGEGEELEPSGEIRTLRARTGLSQVAFAATLGIPRRTIENWESGASTPPPYVIDLIKYKIEHEDMRKES